MDDALTVVKDAYACFGRGDIPGLLRHLDPAVDWHFVGDRRAPYTGSARGHAAVGQWFQKVGATDAIQAFEPREFLAGPGHVTVLGWERTAAIPGGRVFECEWVHVWTLRGGLVTRFWGMLDSEASASARA